MNDPHGKFHAGLANITGMDLGMHLRGLLSWEFDLLKCAIIAQQNCHFGDTDHALRDRADSIFTFYTDTDILSLGNFNLLALDGFGNFYLWQISTKSDILSNNGTGTHSNNYHLLFSSPFDTLRCSDRYVRHWNALVRVMAWSWASIH